MRNGVPERGEGGIYGLAARNNQPRPGLETAEKIQIEMAKARTQSSRRVARRMVFERRNYVLLLAGLALIVIGYTAMRVENEVDGFVSLFVAPVILLAGYLGIIYAILWRPTKPADAGQSQ